MKELGCIDLVTLVFRNKHEAESFQDALCTWLDSLESLCTIMVNVSVLSAIDTTVTLFACLEDPACVVPLEFESIRSSQRTVSLAKQRAFQADKSGHRIMLAFGWNQNHRGKREVNHLDRASADERHSKIQFLTFHLHGDGPVEMPTEL